jgi:branched-chain amino acid aminotransferase
MHRYLLHNGEIHETAARTISPGQTGFLNGWGIFSTIRVFDGVLFAFPRHYARMKRDAELMHVPFAPAPDELEDQLLRLVQANEAWNATLRVAVVRNRGGIFEGAGITRDADTVVFTADLNAWGDGVRLCTIPNARHAASPFAGTKVTSWSQNLTWYEIAHDRGYDEALLLNEFGSISECTSANVFAVIGSDVLTPPLAGSGCLPGVTRAILLEEIRVPGMHIREAELKLADLMRADQVFITSTTRNLLPVLSIDNRETKQMPAAFQTLSEAFNQYQASWAKLHSRAIPVQI